IYSEMNRAEAMVGSGVAPATPATNDDCYVAPNKGRSDGMGCHPDSPAMLFGEGGGGAGRLDCRKRNDVSLDHVRANQFGGVTNGSRLLRYGRRLKRIGRYDVSKKFSCCHCLSPLACIGSKRPIQAT